MWAKFIRLFKKNDRRVSNNEIMDELRDIKKIFRKQGIFLDVFKKELMEKIDDRGIKDIKHFLEFTEAFFYLDGLLQKLQDISPKQQETIEIVWQKLESLLSSLDIEVIRRVGVDFDPRLYETVERMAEADEKPIVEKILQPGYIYRKKVIKPAKVIIKQQISEEMERRI